jgi:hypothetical protein
MPSLVKTRSRIDSLTIVSKIQVSDAEPGEDQVLYRFADLSSYLSFGAKLLMHSFRLVT